MNTKINELFISASLTLYDVLFFSETWLNKSVLDGELGFDKYCVYRRDRDPKSSGKTRGGGVMICIAKKYKSRPIKCLHTSLEQVFAEIVVPTGTLIVGCVYIPPDSGIDVYTKHCESVEKIRFKYPDANVLLTGDYNLPHAEWNFDAMGGESDEKIIEIKQMSSFLGFGQYNLIRNGLDRVLDLVLSDVENINVFGATDPLLPADAHHPPLEIDFVLDGGEVSESNEVRRNFGVCNYVSINNHLAGIDWSFVDGSADINDKVSQFYSVVYGSIEEFVPIKKPLDSRFPKWFSQELIEKINLKKRLHVQYKFSNSSSDYELFSTVRRECQVLARAAKSHFYKNIEDQLPGSAINLHKLARSLKGDQTIATVQR